MSPPEPNHCALLPCCTRLLGSPGDAESTSPCGEAAGFLWARGSQQGHPCRCSGGAVPRCAMARCICSGVWCATPEPSAFPALAAKIHLELVQVVSVLALHTLTGRILSQPHKTCTGPQGAPGWRLERVVLLVGSCWLQHSPRGPAAAVSSCSTWWFPVPSQRGAGVGKAVTGPNVARSNHCNLNDGDSIWVWWRRRGAHPAPVRVSSGGPFCVDLCRHCSRRARSCRGAGNPFLSWQSCLPPRTVALGVLIPTNLVADCPTRGSG